MLLHFFLLSGQSNMVGQGLLSDYPPSQPVNGSRLRTFKNGGWEIPSTPITQDAGVGPGVPMADRLATLRPTMNIALVPAAHSSTTCAQWAAPSGSLLTNAVAQWQGAIANCPIGYTPVPGGIFHWQGESDTVGNPPTWQNWVTDTKAFIQNFRSAVNVPSLPVVYVQLANRTFDGKPYWEDVRAEQDKLRQDAELNGTVKMVNTDDLTISDVHPPTSFHLEIGRRASNRFNALL